MGHVASTEDKIIAYRVLVRKPGGKRLVGRPRYRWEDNINVYYTEIEFEGLDGIELAPDKHNGGLFKKGKELSGFVNVGNILSN